MFDGGVMHTMGVIAEVGNLVSQIGDVASHALIEEVKISDN